MKHKSVILVMALSLGGGAILHGASADAAAVLTAAVSLENCLHCDYQPFYCSPQDHDAYDGGGDEQDHHGAGAHPEENPCWIGNCLNNHPPDCVDGNPIAASTLDQLRLAILERDTEGFHLAVKTIGNDDVRINVERRAVQVFGCNGAVIAHFPVDGAVVRQFAE